MKSTFVESLKRLYTQGKITLDKIDALLNNKHISKDDYNYIISDYKEN